jgi:DNA-binding NarL/FixJ family response regulator
MTIYAIVIDDDPSWQAIISELLGDCGLEVDLASSLPEAIQRIKAVRHRLAIVDLSLHPTDHSNEDGLRVLEALRLHDPACQSVLLTGYATVELAVSAITGYGVFTFLRKESFHRSQFRDLVNRILSTPQPGSSGPASLAAPASVSTIPPAPSARAILVDDDAGWRNILAELLMDAGYTPRICNSLGEALGCLRREKFNLAVVDLSLTGSPLWVAPASDDLEGYELLNATRSLSLPTIVVSGVASVDDIQRAYDQTGIVAFLEKQTFDRAAFLRAVQSARQPASGLESLTEREREVLDLLAQGLTNKEIAEKLFITSNTVKRHTKAIFDKLDVHTRAAAAAKALG